ncbi:MAG: hypothetical protein QW292_13045 [Candidatus Parvarchaeota archaeon]
MTDNLLNERAHLGYEDHWLYDQRMLWPGQFGSVTQYQLMKSLENMLYIYPTGLMHDYALQRLAWIRTNLGLRFEILRVQGLKRTYEIILPWSNGVMSIIKKDPTTIAIFGDRKAGKTVTSWFLAWELYASLKETKEGVEIHVYGDADAISKTLIEYSARSDIPDAVKGFANVVTEHKDYEMPEITGRNQIIIYNEVGEATSSRRGLAKENLEIVLRSLRVRHERRWMIFNIIRPQTVDVTLRESPIKIVHHCTQDNMASIEAMVREPWRPIAWRTSALRPGEAIAIYSLLGYQVPDKIYTTAVDLFAPRPPRWLLDVIERSKTYEVAHADEIEFMRHREIKMPKEDVIIDQTYEYDVVRSRKEFQKVSPEKVWKVLMDWKVRGEGKKKAAEKNGIALKTLNRMIEAGIIKEK